ncbi:MAG: carboxypeptidase regulatory-like domain-containing protein [Verrucomicrobia bacterium]|nr:carboxypeptidase regulatory-like domain-containing protein [Verrucomicrobiota bacterium]
MRAHLLLRRGPSAFFGLLLSLIVTAVALRAQPGAATGTIEGRVFNPANNTYVERARLTVAGTNLEAFSDADGNYRLDGVPAGTATVNAFRTGLPLTTATVQVVAGTPAQLTINLGKADDAVVKLDAFVVESKSMDGAAIAINEQRFSSQMKTVVGADEFGQVAEGNAAEFMKFLPGVAIENGGGNARNIYLNGAPTNNVPVTVAGLDLASAGVGGMGRAVAMDMVSINNVSRIEIVQSPTPESPGSALAGSVNMVPRSAFERLKPEFNGSAFVMMRDSEHELGKTPGPTHKETYKWHPGFDLAYTVPVNKRFGFALSFNHSTQYSPQDWVGLTWRGTNGAIDANYAPTTPDKPYLTNYSYRDDTKETGRTSLGVSFDYRLTDRDRISVAYQSTQNYVDFFARQFNFNIQRALSGNFGPTFTRGDTGAPATASYGNVQVTNNAIYRSNRTDMPTLTWIHNGPTWRFEGGFGYSRASNVDRDTEFGFLQGATATRGRLRVNFDDVTYLRPGMITVLDDANGQALDPYRLDNKALTTAASNPRIFRDYRKSAYLNSTRRFDWSVPVTIKTGLDLRIGQRDAFGGTTTFTYVGADGVAAPTPNTPVGNDNGAGPFLDESFSQRTPPWGFTRTDWMSAKKIYAAYTARPANFTINPVDVYNSYTNLSKRAEEKISAGYVRFDAAFFERRLNITTGLRAEQTNIDAYGPLNNPVGNLQKDAQGRPIRGTTIFPAASLDARKLILLERGAHVQKEYLRYFPSLNANYSIRPNLIARGAYYWSVGRPDFNQYAGGVTLPDLTATPDPNTAAGRITVNNVGIKPWKAESYKLRLEYYFEKVGQVSIGGFRRTFSNFWRQQQVTPTPEFYENFGIDPTTYGNYQFFTDVNQPGTYTLNGFETDYRQALTFLPNWARGVQVFGNVSLIHESGAVLGSTAFAGFVPRVINWGVSLTRPKFNVRVNVNFRGRQRLGAVTGAGVESGTYRYAAPRRYVDLVGEYHLTRRYSLFMNLRNLNDAWETFEVYGPNTPGYAKLANITDFHPLWTFGVKGRF